MSIERRLAELGLELPPPRPPAFSYMAVVRDGNTAWVSGQLPWAADGTLPKGKLGAELDVSAGKHVARQCVLNGLAVLRDALGNLDSVSRVLKVTGFVASASGFVEQPAVMDGASQLLLDVFGEAGRHARSAVGVAELPRGVPVEVELVVAIRSER